MLIQCTIIREGATIVPLDKGTSLTFADNGTGAKVCDVQQKDHIKRLLSMPRFYRKYQPKGSKVTPAQEQLASVDELDDASFGEDAGDYADGNTTPAEDELDWLDRVNQKILDLYEAGTKDPAEIGLKVSQTAHYVTELLAVAYRKKESPSTSPAGTATSSNVATASPFITQDSDAEMIALYEQGKKPGEIATAMTRDDASFSSSIVGRRLKALRDAKMIDQ